MSTNCLLSLVLRVSPSLGITIIRRRRSSSLLFVCLFLEWHQSNNDNNYNSGDFSTFYKGLLCESFEIYRRHSSSSSSFLIPVVCLWSVRENDGNNSDDEDDNKDDNDQYKWYPQSERIIDKGP